MKNFKKLSTGVKRAIIAGTIPGAMIIASIIGALDSYSSDGVDFLAYSIIFGAPLYWIIVFIGLWIYDGFSK